MRIYLNYVSFSLIGLFNIYLYISVLMESIIYESLNSAVVQTIWRLTIGIVFALETNSNCLFRNTGNGGGIKIVEYMIEGPIG
jgi:hypothetical protein